MTHPHSYTSSGVQAFKQKGLHISMIVPEMAHRDILNRIGVTTMEEHDQSSLYPLIKHMRQTCPSRGLNPDLQDGRKVLYQ
jgi:hypothetical protein